MEKGEGLFEGERISSLPQTSPNAATLPQTLVLVLGKSPESAFVFRLGSLAVFHCICWGQAEDAGKCLSSH